VPGLRAACSQTFGNAVTFLAFTCRARSTSITETRTVGMLSCCVMTVAESAPKRSG